MAKYNRLAFMKFAAARTVKHKGKPKQEKDYLNAKFVTASAVNSVLGLLNGFNYALMGGFALGFHGYQRATTDIDIMVNGGDIPKITQTLNLKNVQPLTFGGITGETIDGTSVDLVAPSWPWIGEALMNAQQQIGGKVLSKPFMVLAKLWAGRGTVDDMDSLQMIKRMTPQEKKQTTQLIKKYMPNDVEDLQQMYEFSAYVS